MWMYPAVLKLGEIWLSTASVWFYTELLVLLFSIGAVGLWIAEARKHRHESTKPTAMHTPSMAAMAARMKKAGTAASKPVLFIALGAIFGYLLRDHQATSNQHEYSDVSVVKVLTADTIRVQIPGLPKLYDWTFCQPRKFEVGQVFDIRYEKDFVRDCKQLSGPNSVWFHKENLNAELSTR